MLSYRAKRLLSLLILLVGLPLYIFLVVTIIALFNKQTVFLELLIYFVLGLAWILPFKFIFKGIGQKNPDEK